MLGLLPQQEQSTELAALRLLTTTGGPDLCLLGLGRAARMVDMNATGHDGAPQQVLATYGWRKRRIIMNTEELNNLMRAETDYNVAIAAATDDTTKLGLEQLKDF